MCKTSETDTKKEAKNWKSAFNNVLLNENCPKCYEVRAEGQK